MSHSVNHGRMRLGKMPKWQKWSSYFLFAVCMFTGLVWFLLADVLNWMPPQLKTWWIAHGISSLLTFLLIGASLPMHISVTWRAKRNRALGAFSGAILFILMASALFLYYGGESLHDLARLVHIILGLLLVIAFPWHIIHGKKASSQVSSMLKI